MYNESFKEFFERVSKVFFITLQNYINTELDKTEMLVNLKKQNAIKGNRILSRNMEYFLKIDK